MKTSRVLLLLGLALTLFGCQVVKRAEICGQLAEMLQERQAKLAPALPADPSPQALDHKAKLYRELARDMKKLSFDHKQLEKQRGEVVQQLKKLATELDRASVAVTVHREELAEEKRRKAEKKRAAEVKRQQEQAKVTLKSEGASPERTDSKAESGTSGSAAPGEVLPATERKAPRPRRDRNAQRKPAQPRRHGQRDYQRARSAAESAGRALKKAVDELSQTCS